MSSTSLERELVEERIESVKQERVALGATLAGRRARLGTLESESARLRKERALADADVDKRVRVLESRRRDLSALRDEMASLRAEIRGLEEVDRAFAAASPALAWALSKSKEFPGLIGPLAEHIDAPESLEHVVEHVLGSDLFALLVADTAAVNEIAGALRGRTEGEITLLPVDAMRQDSTRRVEGDRLVDSISCAPEYRPVIEALLGDVLMAPTLDAAARMDRAGCRVVTPDGEVVWPNGKVTAGKVVSDNAGVLERKRRMNSLADEVEALNARVGDSEAAVSEAEEALVVAQQDALEIGQSLAAVTGEYDSLREEVGRLEVQLTTMESDNERVESRLSGIDEQLSRYEPARVSLQSTIAEREAAIKELEEQAAAAGEVRENRFRDESAIGERLSSCQVDIATISEREIHHKKQITTITTELADLEETIVAARRTEDALELLRERIQPVHDLFTALLEKAEYWAVKLRDRARFEQADSESLRETIHAAQEAVRAVQAEIDEHVSGAGDVRVRKGQLEVQVSAAAARIVEDIGVPLEKALDSEPIEDRDKVQDRVHRLRKRLENIGPVNPIAMQERDMLKDRRERLAGSMDDLVAGRKALSKVIAAIDKKMRERFLETFEQVDAHFQDVFRMLFPGGSASLALTDPDDPETTGVEVVAQPVGKKLSKMSLLSGGEKSLTALALLFALYRTRPCPFYILDEVEAALDDSNLRRFIAFLDGMRDRTQFIVVTHQRRTMEMADALYGVTMQADGVSRLLSQKVSRPGEAEPTDDRALV